MKSVLHLDGKVAVVTGAGSGIGRALAQSLARRGCHLALADINESGLTQTADLISGVRVSRHILDVADDQAVAVLPTQVMAVHPHVDILINNAGVALAGSFVELSADDFDWLIAINFQGVVRMSRAFLPHLQSRPQAQLVNLSSIFGIVAPPGQSAYAAAKFAVRGFSEALRHELAAAGSPVGVTVVHPGGVRTAIASSARFGQGVDPALTEQRRRGFEKALRLPPDDAAEIIVRAIERRRPRVLVGGDAKLLSALERLMPVSYWSLVSRALGQS